MQGYFLRPSKLDKVERGICSGQGAGGSQVCLWLGVSREARGPCGCGYMLGFLGRVLKHVKSCLSFIGSDIVIFTAGYTVPGQRAFLSSLSVRFTLSALACFALNVTVIILSTAFWRSLRPPADSLCPVSEVFKGHVRSRGLLGHRGRHHLYFWMPLQPQ